VQEQEKLDSLVKDYRVFYHKEGRFMASFYPGILEVLQTLKKGGYKLAIASMKNEDLVIEMMEHFKTSHYFDAFFGLDLEGKMTKALLLKKGFEEFGLKKDECVLVGDTLIDKMGAMEAGCHCICVNWGFGFTKEDEGTISDPLSILDLV
ncbi:MAG: HAD hydrolase-like protein, partial [Sphaerochaetaceae bacterium]|nr:HAD hydrolase-like protein [Sphaerochaetaceae bacterium]